MSNDVSKKGDLLPSVIVDIQALQEAGEEGAEVAAEYIQANLQLLSKLWGPYNADGDLHEGHEGASAFNDLYKFTMYSVVRAVHAHLEKPLRVTFTVNIRDKDYAALCASDASLQELVKTSVEDLTHREFDRSVFERAVADQGLPWNAADLDELCGPAGAPRTLVQRVSDQPGDFDDDGVVVRVYLAPNAKEAAQTGGEPKQCLYIEATGPWFMVTWLETTLMQCVYKALLAYDMQKKATTFSKELARACARCVRSVDASNLYPDMRPSVFAGRRTMGMPLLLFHTIYCGEYLKGCLGTSSVAAHYRVKDTDPTAPNLKPVGTHAHELSMVLMALWGDIDDKCGAPVSQALGHALYYSILKPERLPILPDTLGTEAFLKVAQMFPIEGTTMKDIAKIARQDSGALSDFVELLKEYNCDAAVMASEIENAADLEAAAGLGYAFTGAGGFYGDSKKAWGQGKNLSMAVKATEVFVDEVRTISHPVKLGDSFKINEDGVKVFSKLEVDGKLTKEEILAQKDRSVALAQGEPQLAGVEEAVQLHADIVAEHVRTH